jgi:arsenate reductase
VSEIPNILFLCTGNSARSILAEALATCRYGEWLSARSAGSRPTGVPNPLALETLARHGLPVDRWHSKTADTLAGETFDLVITLCDSAAREACPTLPGRPTVVHWGLPDPPAARDPAAMFEVVFALLDEALASLASGDPDTPLADRARELGKGIDETLSRR